MRVTVAIALGAAIVVAGLVVVLSQSAVRLSGSNSYVAVSGVELWMPGREGRRCTRPLTLPEGTREIRMFAGTHGRPGGPLEVLVSTPARAGVPSRVITRAPVPFGFGDGAVDARLPRTMPRDTPATVCVVNRSRGATAFAGNSTPASKGANPEGKVLDDDVRMDFRLDGERSWWSMAGTVAERMGLTRTSFFGTWTLFAVLAFSVALFAAGIVVLRRGLAR